MYPSCTINPFNRVCALQWPRRERDGISNHRRLDCLFNRLFWRRSTKISKLRVTCLCEGNPPVDSSHKRPVKRKMLPLDNITMAITTGETLWWRVSVKARHYHLGSLLRFPRYRPFVCREFAGCRWSPLTRPVMLSFDVFIDLRLNKRLTIETPVTWDAITLIMTSLSWYILVTFDQIVVTARAWQNKKSNDFNDYENYQCSFAILASFFFIILCSFLFQVIFSQALTANPEK